MTSLDNELLAVIYGLEKFGIHLDKPFTVRTDCEAIAQFYGNLNEKNLSRYFVNKLFIMNM